MAKPESVHPNILFISMDDLNDWIGCMGGHPQAKTPNIDRLAASGVLFSNAHCPSPSCNPSRTAIMTGIPCYKTGLYDNRQRMRNKLPDAEIMPKYFSRNGYWSAGSGKLLHYFIDADSWDDYFPAKETENPFPNTLYPPSNDIRRPRCARPTINLLFHAQHLAPSDRDHRVARHAPKSPIPTSCAQSHTNPPGKVRPHSSPNHLD